MPRKEQETPYLTVGETWGDLMELVYSPHDMEILLQQPASWDAKEDRPVSLAEYISTRLPQVAASLGLRYMRTENPARDVDELTDEEQRKLTLGLLEHEGPKNWALAIGRRSYSYEEIIDGVRHNLGFGPEYVHMTISGRGFFLRLVEAGKLRIDSDKPDIGSSPPKLPEFPF